MAAVVVAAVEEEAVEAVGVAGPTVAPGRPVTLP